MDEKPSTTDDPTAGPAPVSQALGPLLFITAMFFLNFGSRMVLAPLMPAVEADLGIGHGQAGSLFLMISLGYGVGLLSSGFLSARVAHHRIVGLTAVGIGAVLLAMSAGHALWQLRLGLVLVGVGAGLYLPSGMAVLTALVVPGDWGKALAIHEFAPNLAFMLSPLIAEALLRRTSWMGALWAFGAANLIAGIAFLRFGRGGRFRGQAPSWRELGTLLATPSFAVMVVLMGLGLGSSMGIYAMLPLYLTSDLGFSRGWANGLVALSRVSGLLTVFGSGWLSDRLGPRRALLAILGAGGVITVLLGAANRTWVIPLALLQPTLAAWFFPAAFAALSRIGPLAVSFAVPLAMVLGGGVIPTLIGTLGERGWFALGISLVGVSMLAGAALATRLDLGERRPATGEA